MIGVEQGIYWKKTFLMRFQDGCKKDLISNQLTVMTIEQISTEEEPEVPRIYEKPDETVPS